MEYISLLLWHLLIIKLIIIIETASSTINQWQCWQLLGRKINSTIGSHQETPYAPTNRLHKLHMVLYPVLLTNLQVQWWPLLISSNYTSPIIIAGIKCKFLKQYADRFMSFWAGDVLPQEINLP